ncbi:MAG: hypothetical protein Q8K30_04410 [Candidatus Gracilibacteria bacterium]|nr:hypothetical protein [Candidatus Gracilibacteria bacterium]
MYLLLLIPAYVVVYFLIIWWFQIFFDIKEKAAYNWNHVLIILGIYFLVIYGISFIDNHEIANRIQHAMGGGFLMVILTYFSILASKENINKFQFIFLAFFIATTFGVFNELAESVFQNTLNIQFAPNINDTWFDLWANSIGAVLGIIIFINFISKKN